MWIQRRFRDPGWLSVALDAEYGFEGIADLIESALWKHKPRLPECGSYHNPIGQALRADSSFPTVPGGLFGMYFDGRWDSEY